MNFDRLALCLLTLYLLYLLYQLHRTRLRRLWQRSKNRLPRTWKPQSPRDCACCQTGVCLAPLPDPKSVTPWSQCKSTRGRKKTVDTDGYACPHPACKYFGITDDNIHALVGYGWIDQAQTIRKLCCQACPKPSLSVKARLCTISKPSPIRSRWCSVSGRRLGSGRDDPFYRSY